MNPRSSNAHRQSLALQVAVVDLNEACGEECKVQLDAEFGQGQCIFIQCDVSDGDALRGERRSVKPELAAFRAADVRGSGCFYFWTESQLHSGVGAWFMLS